MGQAKTANRRSLKKKNMKNINNEPKKETSVKLSIPQIKLLLRALADREQVLDERFYGNNDHPRYASYEKSLVRIDELEQLLFDTIN